VACWSRSATLAEILVIKRENRNSFRMASESCPPFAILRRPKLDFEDPLSGLTVALGLQELYAHIVVLYPPARWRQP
jgi:hypothetical protein